MTTLKELIETCEYKSVYNCLEKHYKDMKKTSINKFEVLYKNLLNTKQEENLKNMYIYISVFKDCEDDEDYAPVYQENFDENDFELYFDVSGRDDEHCGYSLVGSKFESWLGYYIDDSTLEKMTPPNIIAHCLWEITFFGFDQKIDEDGERVFD